MRPLLLALLTAAAAPCAAAQEALVYEAAVGSIEARFPADAHRIEVRVDRVDPDLATADLSAIRLDFPRPTLPKGPVQVGVRGPAGEKLGWARLYVAHYDSVIVATARLSKDAPVPSGVLQAAWTETTRFRGDPLRPPLLRALAAAGEVFSTRSLREGALLRTTDVRAAYAAELGTSVAMTYERHGLALTLACKARQAGAVGQIVKLYSPDTDAHYRARLTAPGQATWIETL